MKAVLAEVTRPPILHGTTVVRSGHPTRECVPRAPASECRDGPASGPGTRA
eukprot:CAMPEP_0180306938 /NCGR_PEP_ID=MMETSP0988-20121125/27409_1 /TAXON_ID=697907 /ORGANISM="non described non described, Strain CCMP2293" /LENGTH=50 /DNA_ID=CAMNT_0022289837 /DNA_START=14 /DNA_END=163 /DNA_ORIENTATION=-